MMSHKKHFLTATPHTLLLVLCLFFLTLSLWLFRAQRGSAETKNPPPPSLQLEELRTWEKLRQLAPQKELNPRHVLFFHWDAARGDLVQAMLRQGQLPFLSTLLKRGKINCTTATVDKSETMGVIPRYLTSRRNLDVVGWWQYNRRELRYQNFALDFTEAVSYLLGLSFPRYPTIMDFLASRGETNVTGFSLYSRGVERKNYARAYDEGLRALFDHTYLHQARAVMTEFLNTFRRIASNPGEKIPRFSLCVLTALDEFGHLDGVSLSEETDPGAYVLLKRSNPLLAPFFDELDSHHIPSGSSVFSPWKNYLLEEKSLWYPFPRHVKEAAIALPELSLRRNPVPSLHMDSLGIPQTYRAAPGMVFSMMFYDMQLGRLMDLFYAIRLDSRGTYRLDEELYAGLRKKTSPPYFSEPPETYGNSLLANTLFFIFGDHGMADTAHMMAPNNPYQSVSATKASDSLNTFFVDALNDLLGLDTWEKGTVPPQILLGCDDRNLPREAAYPFSAPSWQEDTDKALVEEAFEWSRNLLDKTREVLSQGLRKKYWWTFPLWNILIDGSVEKALKEYEPFLTDLLMNAYLRGFPEYQHRAAAFRRTFYDTHIRLIHGGGVRNNAELFLPGKDAEGRLTWEYRPSLEELRSFRFPSGKTLFQALQALKGTGLIFARCDNPRFASGKKLPGEMALLVEDRYGNRGTIRVRPQEKHPHRLEFAYTPTTPKDPLGYFASPQHPMCGPYFSFEEWNNFSILQQHAYPNVPGGMGTYFYSTNPALGDVLVMHSQGWNFGAYRGNHGGIHWGEKITFLAVSGPGISPGTLMARDSRENLCHPTLLDMAPTALAWLGYGPKALTEFSRNGFEEYLQKWRGSQREEAVAYYASIEDFQEILKQFRLAPLDLRIFEKEVDQLLQFIDTQPSLSPPDSFREDIDGNILLLENKGQ